MHYTFMCDVEQRPMRLCFIVNSNVGASLVGDLRDRDLVMALCFLLKIFDADNSVSDSATKLFSFSIKPALQTRYFERNCDE